MNYTRKNKSRWRPRHPKPYQYHKFALSHERHYKEDFNCDHASNSFMTPDKGFGVKKQQSQPVKDICSFLPLPKTKLRIQSESFQISELKNKQEISTDCTTPKSESNQEIDLHVSVRVRGETVVPSFYLQFEDSKSIFHTPKSMTSPLSLKLEAPSWE